MTIAKGGGGSVPVHYYVDDSHYFITAATYQHRPLLTPDIKDRLAALLKEVYSELGWELLHWVILDTHYHLLAHSRRGRDLTRIINKTHSKAAGWINQARAPADRGAKSWYNYWDYCPRNEDDYQVRLCYLLYNPVKHGYVTDLKDWPWSSFHQLYREKGRDQMAADFVRYREFRALNLPEDGF